MEKHGSNAGACECVHTDGGACEPVFVEATLLEVSRGAWQCVTVILEPKFFSFSDQGLLERLLIPLP